ncbi:hypothetical protein TUM20985_04530 [Mycobacterium antarcticum]|nr:hypothetical protein TUM20985_04530 [Mycolicibacterium sp. TUM20985]
MTVTVALLVGTGIWWFFFRGPSSADCAPVRELLAFNKSQIDGLNAKTHVPEPGSYEAATDPGELDYRAWVDGLTDRAAKVTAPELADQAKETAKTAERLVRARLDFDAQSQSTAPGAAAPAVAMVVTAFNDEFESRVRQLATTCPA